MKHNLVIALILVSLSTFFFSSCSGPQNTTRIPLDSQWMWTADNENPDSFVPLDKAKMSSLEQLLPSKKGYVWLKHDFFLPATLADKDLSCYLGRITMADRTWLNGIFIGGEGSAEPDSLSEWNKARLYSVPSIALEREGVNTLLVQIRIDNEGAIVSNPFIGLREDARFAALTETFWNSTINLICAAIMIIMGGYHFLLFIKRPIERENFLFAMINFLTAVYLSNFYITELPGIPYPGMSFLWFQKIVANSLIFIVLFMVSSFIKQFLGRKEHVVIRILRLICMIVPLVAVFSAPDYGTLRNMRGWTQLFVLPPLLYIMYMSFNSLVRKNKEAIALLWGLSPLVLTVLLDIGLHNVLKLYSLPYVSGFGWQLVIVSLLFVLASRFAGARNEVEELNVSLEKKVEERTHQLSEANHLMQITNNDLQEARDIADKDMKMAAFVQQSFFARKAPEVNGWDVAFVFKPMSGVSGDLYDFYTDRDELRGVSLFDVSGHGIAAGLVTMLAKTIIYRQFHEGAKTLLSNVMSMVDRKLIQEKGDIENYLTGLMLRISGSKIEYVSAGHPEIYYRNGKTGSVRPVMLEGKDAKGRMLGIDGLSDGYTAIGFNLMDEDSLLLYTDCLPEARNAAGEEFGNDRIREYFALSGNGLASDKLEFMLGKFKEFIGDVPLNDDLTVIVLQRTDRKKSEDLDDFVLPE